MTKHELGNSLSRLLTRKTILVEYSTGGCDGRLLEGTLTDVERADVTPDLDPIRVVKCFRQAFPGLLNYKLSTVFSMLFPGDSLVQQAHRAAPDAVMLQKIVDFLARAVEGEFLTVPSAEAPVLRPKKMTETKQASQRLITALAKPKQRSEVMDSDDADDVDDVDEPDDNDENEDEDNHDNDEDDEDENDDADESDLDDSDDPDESFDVNSTNDKALFWILQTSHFWPVASWILINRPQEANIAAIRAALTELSPKTQQQQTPAPGP
ncbi:MAG: hypothetical protein M1826_004927 [Phylliscum demangeonii]|nr:MAG: hypothetical protein M1826_004927 [Phylliscum demangeonii]